MQIEHLGSRAHALQGDPEQALLLTTHGMGDVAGEIERNLIEIGRVNAHRLFGTELQFDRDRRGSRARSNGSTSRTRASSLSPTRHVMCEIASASATLSASWRDRHQSPADPRSRAPNPRPLHPRPAPCVTPLESNSGLRLHRSLIPEHHGAGTSLATARPSGLGLPGSAFRVRPRHGLLSPGFTSGGH